MPHDSNSIENNSLFSFLSFLKNRSIARNITISLLIIVTVVTASFSFFFYTYQSRKILSSSERKITVLTDKLSTMLASPLASGNAMRVEELCSMFSINSLVDEIRVEDARGRILYGFVKNAHTADRIERQKDIIFANAPAGRVHLIFSLHEQLRNRNAILQASIIITLITALTIFSVTGALIRTFLNKPLRALEQTVSNAAKGDFTTAPALPLTELAPIATCFSRMSNNLELREAELQHIHEQLQTEIAAGTRIKEALRISEERYSLAMQGSNDGFWDWDLLSNAIYFSPRWKAMLGYADDEMPNAIAEWFSRVAPEDQEWLRKKIHDYQKGLVDEFQFEYRLQHSNGSYRWIHTRGLCLWDESGKAYRMAGANTDITDRKIFEDYVWEAKTTLDNVLNAMPSRIIGVNKAGRVTLWNSTAVHDTGKSRSEAINHLFSSIMPEFSFLQHDIRRAIAEEQTITLKRLSTSAPSGSRYHDIVIYPVVMYGTYNAIVRIDDITERVNMEEIMVQTEKMLSVGGLAAGMAHEINNPLGGILQGAQNILRRLDPDLPPNIAACEQVGCDMRTIRAYMEQRDIIRFLEGIRESGARAASIVSNMLEFSRRSDTMRAPVSIPQLVSRTLELAANDYDLKKQYDFRHIEIIEHYAPDLPEVVCSATELQQVFLNLFKNAAQAMPQRGPGRTDQPAITIRAEAERGEVHIEVTDNGPGMREDVRRRIFEPFFTTKAAGEGTGLGLPVSYFIVTSNHGGNMAVTSEYGRGSTFIITLPVKPDTM